MAKFLSFIDGFKGRPIYGQGSWPGGGSFEIPGGMGGADDPHILVGEGRFGGAAGGGVYDSWFGAQSYFGNYDLTTLYPWFQCGMWVKFTHRGYIGGSPYGFIAPRTIGYGATGDPTLLVDGIGYTWTIDYTTRQILWGGVLSGVVVPYLELGRWYWLEYRIYASTTVGIGEVYIDNYYNYRFTNIQTANAAGASGWNGWDHDYAVNYRDIQGVNWDSLYIAFADTEEELPAFSKKWAEPAVTEKNLGWSDYIVDNKVYGEDMNVLTQMPADDQNFITMREPTTGDYYEMEPTNLISTWSTVGYGVKHTIRARKTSAGPVAIKPYCYIGGTKYYGGTYYLSGEFREYMGVWRVNPSSGAEWTRTTLNTALFGFEVV